MARTGYCGEVGETDLPWYLLGTRFFVPWLIRFLSPDPVSPFGAGGFNRYAYCAGDPINRIDPNGNAWWDWLGVAFGAVAGVAATVVTLGAATPVMTLAIAGVVGAVVSVAATIGAAVAMGLGDEKLGGVLGWVAVGAGTASIGAGAATNALSKGANKGLGRKGSGFSQGSLPGTALPDRMPKGVVTQLVNKKNRHLTILTGHGLDARAPSGRVVRVKGMKGFGIGPSPQHWLSGESGEILTFDSRVSSSYLHELVESLAREDANRKINLFTSHGTPEGSNWVVDKMTNAERFHPSLEASSKVESLRQHLRQYPNVTVHDMTDIVDSNAFSRMISEDNVTNVLGFCYSVADQKVNDVLMTIKGAKQEHTIFHYFKSPRRKP